MVYRVHTIQNSSTPFTVTELCAIAGVSRSGYYAWLKAAPSREQRELQDKADFELILSAYKMYGYTKGRFLFRRFAFSSFLRYNTP